MQSEVKILDATSQSGNHFPMIKHFLKNPHHHNIFHLILSNQIIVIINMCIFTSKEKDDSRQLVISLIFFENCNKCEMVNENLQ